MHSCQVKTSMNMLESVDETKLVEAVARKDYLISISTQQGQLELDRLSVSVKR